LGRTSCIQQYRQGNALETSGPHKGVTAPPKDENLSRTPLATSGEVVTCHTRRPWLSAPKRRTRRRVIRVRSTSHRDFACIAGEGAQMLTAESGTKSLLSVTRRTSCLERLSVRATCTTGAPGTRGIGLKAAAWSAASVIHWGRAVRTR
jgi:hypothetical protein